MSMGEPVTQLLTDHSNNDWWRTLPYQLSNVVVFESIRPAGFRFRKFAFNISGLIDDKSVTATGEADIRELAITKAVAEFIERCALIDFSSNRSDINSSNGWAAHTEARSAEDNAIRELVERDAVLRHWYSRTPCFVIMDSSLPEKTLDWKKSELSRSEFPNLKILVTNLGYGPCVTALLTNESGFGVSGNCSKENLCEAIDGAIEEACRMAHHFLLSSYLDDTFKLMSQVDAKVETGAHGVFYAHQRPFPQWLAGKILSFDEASDLWSKKNSDLLQSMDRFTILEICSAPLFVVRAQSDVTLELNWGYQSLEKLKARVTGKISNINENDLNLEPHIIP
jgi:hypothetical protein